MKTLIIVALLTLSASAFAKDYQTTGEVVENSTTKIIVDKKGEKFEIALPAGVKINGGEIKKGSKVTVYYTMTASSIDVKGDVAPEKTEKADKKKKK